MPKRLHWKPLNKFKLKSTFFSKLNANTTTKDDLDLDYELLKEAFCKREEDIKQEEEEKKKMQEKVQKKIFILE